MENDFYSQDELDYFKIRYLDGNINESEIGLLFNDNNFQIWGTTMKLDRSDCYLTIFLNGMMKDGVINTDAKICRISILKPEYLENKYQPGIKLNSTDKDIFINYITNNWNKVIDYLEYSCWGADFPIDMNLYRKLSCPDYSQLESI